MPLIKSSASLSNLIVMPHVQSAQGCVCMTCGRLVDEEALVEGYPGQTTWAKFLVRHHGAEELRRFDMESTNWDERDLAQLTRRTNWFDPRGNEGLGLNERIVPKDSWVEPEATKIISGPFTLPMPKAQALEFLQATPEKYVAAVDLAAEESKSKAVVLVPQVYCPSCFEGTGGGEEKSCTHGCGMAKCVRCGAVRDPHTVPAEPSWHCVGYTEVTPP